MEMLKRILAIMISLIVIVVCIKLIFAVAGILFKIVLVAIVIAIVFALAKWIYNSFFR